MIKQIMEVLQPYSFTYELNLGYGHINGYEVNVISYDNQIGPVFYFSTYLSVQQKEKFVSEMTKKFIKHLTVSYNDYGVIAQIGAINYFSFQKNAPDTINQIIETLELLEAPKSDICPITGDNLQDDNSQYIKFETSFNRIRLSNDGINIVNQRIDEDNQKYEEAPNNYLKGFLGILIGAIVGVILQRILFSIGFIAVISSVASIYLGIFLYKKFGGKPNTLMVIMACVTTLIFSLVSMYLYYYDMAYNYASAIESTISKKDAFNYVCENVEGFESDFIINMLINIVFTIGGGICCFFSKIKEVKRPKNLEIK